MQRYEYKVVPAPEKGLKGKGVKGSRERFANALQTVMNELGAEGWEYIRADMLPSEERSGLTGSTTVYQNMLVFRRSIDGADAVSVAPAPVAQLAPPAPVAAAVVETTPETPAQPTPSAAEPGAEPEAPAEKAVETVVDSDSTEKAAAEAAQAALAAYRHQGSGAPKLGPASQD